MVCDTVSIVNAIFQDTETYNLPFESIQLENDAITGSLGLFHQLQRMEGRFYIFWFDPNVDDVTMFASGTITVPNKDLTLNIIMQSLQLLKNGIKDILLLVLLYTILQDAIIKDVFTLNRQDSLLCGSTYQLLPTKIHKKLLFGYH